MRHQHSTTFALTLLILGSALAIGFAADGGSTKEVPTAASAIKGAEGSSSGEAYGVVGTSSSPDGAGIGAANLAGGPDLVLDGNGGADALFSQHGIDRPSGTPQTFDFVNSGGGGMTLMVGGVDVVTTTTDSDTLGALSCVTDQMPLWNGSNWTCVNRPTPRDPGQNLVLNGNALDVVGGAGSGLDADTVDGVQLTQLSQKLDRIVTVSPVGGDFSTVQGALDSITDAAEDNRYLVKVGPGVYFEQVTMKPYVDIEGSGQDVTTVRWGAGGTHDGAVLGADHAELRFLTVERNAGSIAIAMYNDATSPRLTHTTLRASGGAVMSLALVNANGAAPTLTHCRIEAMGDAAGGASNHGAGEPVFTNVSIHVEGTTGLSYGVWVMLDSGPVLNDVDISVIPAGGTEAYGIYTTSNGYPTLRSSEVTVDASTTDAYGAWGEQSAHINIVDSEIRVESAGSNTAIHVESSRLDVANSRLVVEGANPEGIHASDEGVDKSAVFVSSSSIDIDMGGIVSLNCFAIFGDGAHIQVDNSILRNSELVNCQQGVSFRAEDSSDRIFVSHTSIRGSYSTVPGITETCLAVSEYLIDPLFYPDTCP
jgi:hypothetical protein